MNRIMNATVLWNIAAILVVVGIVQLVQGQLIPGIILIAAGLLVGLGGVSVFGGSRATYRRQSAIPAIGVIWSSVTFGLC
jgi:hypothetical protein